jgi:septation ring formation regulator EzrA
MSAESAKASVEFQGLRVWIDQVESRIKALEDKVAELEKHVSDLLKEESTEEEEEW